MLESCSNSSQTENIGLKKSGNLGSGRLDTLQVAHFNSLNFTSHLKHNVCVSGHASDELVIKQGPLWVTALCP